MYQMMNADYFVSCLYFIAGIIVLNYWSVVVKTRSLASPAHLSCCVQDAQFAGGGDYEVR